MKPSLALAWVVLALVAGCGGGDGDNDETTPARVSVADRTLAPEKYAEEADDICADTVRRVLEIQKQVGATENPEDAAKLLEQQLDAIRDMRDRLAALGLPEGKEEVARELIADIDDSLPRLEATIDALRDGDEARAQEHAQRYAAASMESARQVRESGLDFEVCGSGA